ncbi:polysaccharide deacetylase family protein [Longispora albida]|uniref:polysaccharide deacetylase family protein n=1 Tax=Longispora albida TaxID=203523 RepID=UPI0003817D93|nr:polysaccharide deacetylase family protein [Longispora albida]
MRKLLLVLVAGCLALAGCSDGDSPKWAAPLASSAPAAITGADAHRLPASIPVPAGSGTPAGSTGNGPMGTHRVTGTADVALTFDDGPSPTWTPQILALLRQHGIKATFCMVGTEVQAYPNLVRAIAADGHTLCSHSWGHELNLGSQAEDAIRANLTRTNQAIAAAVPGTRVKYFRQPGGNWTPRVVAVATSLGMRSLHWAVDTNDWRKPGPDAIYNVVAGQTGPGAIILLHDAGGDRSGTLAACRRIFPLLKSRVTLIPMP